MLVRILCLSILSLFAVSLRAHLHLLKEFYIVIIRLCRALLSEEIIDLELTSSRYMSPVVESEEP